MSRHFDLALIGGTGLYKFPGLEGAERHAVDTPYGHPSDSIVVGQLGRRRVAFLARQVRFAPVKIEFAAEARPA